METQINHFILFFQYGDLLYTEEAEPQEKV